MKHLNERELSAMSDGALAGEALWRAQQHLESCEDCRDALAEISVRDAALDAALRHDPGERYFATFADRVVGRIAEAERAGEADAPVRGVAAERGDMLRAPIRLPWWQRPRALAMVGTAAVVVAGAGIVLMTARQAELPLAHRAGARAPGEAGSEAGSPAARAAKQATEAAPDEAAFRDQAEPAAPTLPPSAPRSNAILSPPASAPEAVAPAPTPGESRLAGGTRMQEVPRERTGDQRATKSATSGFAAPPDPRSAQAPRPEATTAEKLRELKRAALAPSGQKLEQEKPLAKEADDNLAGAAAPAEIAARSDLASQEAAHRLCGVVRDRAGRALAGVSVTAVQAASAATTDANGRFCLQLPAGEHTLQVHAVGFRPTRITVSGEATSDDDVVATLDAVEVLGSGGLARGGEGAQALDRPRQATSPSALGPDAAGNAPRPETAAGPAGLSLGDAPLRALPDSLRSLISGAARLQARAAASSGPSGYESAASAWERLLPAATNAAAEIEVHARVAECRFAAWRRAPDNRRSSRAVEALTRYAARAPAGDRRDLAARWLDQIRGR